MSRFDYQDPFTAPPEWPADVACRETDTAVFFTGRGGNHAAAREICGRCPAVELCAEWALEQSADKLHGVWGGLSRDERRAIRAGRRQADVSAGQRAA